jgi:hypothetical protein
MELIHGGICVSNSLLDLARTIKMSPKLDHGAPPILGAVERLNPIPILGVAQGLLDDSKNLAIVFRVD